MLPLPNDDQSSEPVVIDTGDWPPSSKLARPRVGPLALWYLWLAVSAVGLVVAESFSLDQDTRQTLGRIYIGQVVLTPAWAALAIRPFTSHILSLLLVYGFVPLIPNMTRELKELLLLFLIVIGTWSVLRWCRVIALDLLRPESTPATRTPRLADQVQFSLRALILMSAVVALGISLYLFFHESSGWSFYKIMFFIVVPSELLVFWGVLGRARWYIRLPWLLVATHHWILLGVVGRGFVNWEELYNWDDVPNWIGIPLSQIVSLGLLRWAGYRVGLPRPRERALPVAVAVEPQSPWDEK